MPLIYLGRAGREVPLLAPISLPTPNYTLGFDASKMQEVIANLLRETRNCHPCLLVIKQLKIPPSDRKSCACLEPNFALIWWLEKYITPSKKAGETTQVDNLHGFVEYSFLGVKLKEFKRIQMPMLPLGLHSI